ncbi:hypothetical protein BP6252_04805 [Coleophoma cylindrospora]|uniref:Nucleoporin NUP53 n=1 Tax=Coleophoma cylindrospora TaxID=1849047 RepID=A0A3D8S1J1_9HELO|nr:hypothetical protein BP6252_04805 [Coleophoma cylindrospora]
MPPLILHNVPDEELYVGEDGIQRPYAMVFPGDSNPRIRRAVPETGSFGKSTRRSRSRTGTPAAVRREDPTLAAADAIFTSYLAERNSNQPESPQRKTSFSSSISQPNLSNALASTDGNATTGPRYVHKEPTEVILRGFKSSQQYAAINHYEHLAGRICEDYPRDPPLEQRRYKADLRDPASLRRRAMTPEEKAKALRFAGGEHWIKVTFESAEAADAAVFSSPQAVLGYQVYAELYRGVGPAVDEALPIYVEETPRAGKFSGGERTRKSQNSARRPSSSTPRSLATPAVSQIGRGENSLSPPDSNVSSQTFDTTTLSTVTASSATVTGAAPNQTSESQEASLYCRKIPTARRIQLKPADQALLPQQSRFQNWFSWMSIFSDIIGKQLPKTDTGDFDWANASLYWKVIWWIDSWSGWFDVAGKDE